MKTLCIPMDRGIGVLENYVRHIFFLLIADKKTIQLIADKHIKQSCLFIVV